MVTNLSEELAPSILQPEDEGIMFLCNVYNYVTDYMVS
jgi:hypothetical protein